MPEENLASILNDEPAERSEPAAQPESAPAPEPKAEAAPAPEPKVEAAPEPKAEERPRDESGKFAAKTDAEQHKPETQVKQELTAKEKAFLATAQEERRKRQDLERRMSELEAARQQPQGEKKTFWDDPEAALQNFQNQLHQQTNKVATETRLQTTEMLARSRYNDFDEKVQGFSELMENTPGLYQQWIAAPDPAEFAYKTAKTHMELKRVGDIDNLRSSIEKELRAKLEQEMVEKERARKQEIDSLPRSLSDVGTGQPSRPVWNGPPTLDDILHS
jgi:hypothetical protein